MENLNWGYNHPAAKQGDNEIVKKAKRRAEALGKSVNQLVRKYLEQVAGKIDRKALAEEFFAS